MNICRIQKYQIKVDVKRKRPTVGYFKRTKFFFFIPEGSLTPNIGLVQPYKEVMPFFDRPCTCSSKS